MKEIKYGTGMYRNFISSSGSGSASQKVTVPTVPVPQTLPYLVLIFLEEDLNDAAAVRVGAPDCAAEEGEEDALLHEPQLGGRHPLLVQPPHQPSQKLFIRHTLHVMNSLLALSCSKTPASSLEHAMPIPRRTPASTLSL
jgi:hypothetical protein